MRGQAETEFAQVLRLRDGIAEHRCDASRGSQILDVSTKWRSREWLSLRESIATLFESTF
jgi:hypothetical protein